MIRALIRLCLSAAFGCATAVGIAWSVAFEGFEPDSCSHRPIAWPVGEGEAIWYTLVASRATLSQALMRRIPASIGESSITTMPDELAEANYHRLINNSNSLANGDVPITMPIAPKPMQCNPPPEDYDCRYEYQFGWPFRCLWCSCDFLSFNMGDRAYCHVWQVRGAPTRGAFHLIFDPRFRQGQRYLPTGILWPGLATNTACYTLPWWLLFSTPVWIRDFRRKRRGQCTRCAYDLRATPADAPCPECGVSPKQPLPTTLTT